MSEGYEVPLSYRGDRLTENQNQVSFFYPFVLHEISVLIELTLALLKTELENKLFNILVENGVNY